MRSNQLKTRTRLWLWSTLFAVCTSGLTTSFGQAPKKAETIPVSSLCRQESALEIIQQQMDVTKTFDDRVQRIAVLITTADLLWPFQNEKSRAAFTEAFDLGTQEFSEKGAEDRREGAGLMASTPDQRYVVINAIARQDVAWAQKLTEQLLIDATKEAQEGGAKNTQAELKNPEKLLGLASSLVDSDHIAAVSFARASLRYPATLHLPVFLYKLAAVNQPAADQLYQEALRAYARAPMNRFLFLSAYAFGIDRDAGETPGYTIYRVPDSFAPSPTLQRQFVGSLLARSQQNQPDSPVNNSQAIWMALTILEKRIAASLPDLAPTAEQVRATVYAQLSPNSQRQAGQLVESRNPPKRSFDEQVETAEKNPDVERRDQYLVFAVIGSDSASENLERVLAVVDKISDSNVRQPLLNWLYFVRSQRAIKDKKFDEARKLALKVDELDQRAHLYLSIAEESLKQNPNQTEAQEMLEEIVTAASKAPATIVRARVQLGVAHLYTKLDMNRAIALMSEAVKSINQIEQPDFSSTYVIRRIEGKKFSSYTGFNTPGFSPETAFQEIGKLDFDGMLSQASNLTNKPLRAKTTLALIKPCLKALPPAPTKDKKKAKA